MTRATRVVAGLPTQVPPLGRRTLISATRGSFTCAIQRVPLRSQCIDVFALLHFVQPKGCLWPGWPTYCSKGRIAIRLWVSAFPASPRDHWRLSVVGLSSVAGRFLVMATSLQAPG